MKKILSIVLAVLMVFSVVPAVFADNTVTTTAEETSPYAEALALLGNKDVWLYHGVSEDNAAADEDVTRAQMAMFVARFITGETLDDFWATAGNDSGFPDINSQADAMQGAISFAAQEKIVVGYDNGNFGPDDNVEYRQAITMIVRALGYNYKASGYPWSYINKARELGLLDGISNIGYTDAAPRGVVAQLLYNAMFADVDGKTVAESVFGIGKTTVMITASNAVVYGANDAAVLRTGYVQFKELNDQLEPTGAAYHVNMAEFGLADAKAANAAVGTTYAIYYKDGYANIISAESQTEIFWNYGNDKNEIAVSGGYLTLGNNAKLQVVTSYNGLNAKQGWNQDAAGTAQVKVFSTNATVTYLKAGYYLVGNTIYTINNGFQAWATKSEITGKWYSFDPDKGVYNLIPDADIAAIYESQANVAGFTQQSSAAASAYAQAIASDANADGYFDRAIIKNYSFGTINHKGDVVIGYTFGDAGTNNMKAEVKVNTAKPNDGYTYTWAGLASDQVASGAYAVFHINEATKEIDVLFTIGEKTSDDQDTYVAYGYVRNTIIDGNKITIGNDTLTVGYNSLLCSPLSSVSNAAGYVANYNILSQYFNTYVKYVVVDGNLVKIEAASNSADYVIINKFTNFTENGIVAEGWTTVDGKEGYGEITIAAFNGWTIGGLDFNLYTLSNLFNNNIADLIKWFNGNYDVTTNLNLVNLGFQQIPVTTGTLYQVVYEKDGVYNLTSAVSQVTGVTEPFGASFEFTKTGMMIGTDGANKYDEVDGNNDLYTALTDGDYWMILLVDTCSQTPSTIAKTWKVLSINGKLPFIPEMDGVEAYKLTKGNDYVLVADMNADWVEMLTDANVAGDTQYVMYNAAINGWNNYNNAQFLNGKYVYTHNMIDVQTGAVVAITYDTDLLSLVNPNYNFYQGLSYLSLLNEGAIYKAVNGKLVYDARYQFIDGENKPVMDGMDICQVAEFLWQANVDTIVPGTFSEDYEYTDLADDYAKLYDVIVEDAARLLADVHDSSLNGTKYWETFKGAVTVMVLKDNTITKVTKNDELKARVGATDNIHVDLLVARNAVTVWISDIENAIVTKTYTADMTFERADNNIHEDGATATFVYDTVKNDLTVTVAIATDGAYVTAIDDSQVDFNGTTQGTADITVTDGKISAISFSTSFWSELENLEIKIVRPGRETVYMIFNSSI